MAFFLETLMKNLIQIVKYLKFTIVIDTNYVYNLKHKNYLGQHEKKKMIRIWH